nr:RidA family protein [uncultured Amphritea sp.]
MSSICGRLLELKLKLPEPPEPAANYVPGVKVGDLIFLSGQTPKDGRQIRYKGKLGVDLSVEEGYAAAQLCTLRLLSVLQSMTGDLARVKKIVKLTAFVNASEDFEAHPDVVNGASDLLEKLFGDKGQHARAAVGVSSLPSGAAVEVELIVQV